MMLRIEWMRLRPSTRVAGFFSALALLALAGQAGAEVASLSHDLRLELNPHTQTLEGDDAITLNGGGELSFYLASPLQIESAILNGDPVEYRRAGERVTLPLGPPGEHRLTLTYRGQLRAEPSQPGALTGSAEPLLSEAFGYFPPGSGWYPEFDTVPFSYRLEVILPAEQRAVAPGVIDEQEPDASGQRRSVFSATVPAYELVLFTGPYRVEERPGPGYRVRTYFFEGMEPLAGEYLDFSLRYLELFEARIGDYPYPYFHVVAAPLPVGLGFAGMTYMGERVLRLPFIKHSSLGHEVLHNWWGNGVQVDYPGGNWAEGLTAYMADYHFLARQSEEKARQRRLEWLRDYAALPAERDYPPRQFSGKSHGASQVIGYNKVAFIFHMLQREQGVKAFSRAVSAFWRDRRFQVAGWDDIAAAFEAAAGGELDTFFHQWLDRSGAPRLSLEEVSKTPLAQGGWRVSLVIAQPVPAYQALVEVEVVSKEGSERRPVILEGPRTEVNLELAAEPEELALDPDFHLFRHLGPGEAPPILRDTLLASRVEAVVLGDAEFTAEARALAADMADTPVEVVDTLQGEAPFLLIAPPGKADAFMQKLGLAGPPEPVAGTGSAQVWAGRTAGGQAYTVVRADDVAALSALRRPLPHYGRSSYLAFDGARAVVKGSWPAKGGIRTRL